MGNDTAERVNIARPPKEAPDASARPVARSSDVPPTSYVLRRESELKPRSMLEATEETEDGMLGVQSLHDALDDEAPVGSNSILESRPSTAQSSSDGGSTDSPLMSRKRKANPVHPKIAAAGQRILSSEQNQPAKATRSSSIDSQTARPNAATGLSFRERLRQMSGFTTSSPAHPIDATSSGPVEDKPTGGESPRSLKLSDDDSVSFDDGASQVVLSSSGEEEDADLNDRIRADPPKTTGGPQLVMPTVTLPSRRKATQRGERFGHLQILVAANRPESGHALIDRIVTSCEDIIHVKQQSDGSAVTTLPDGCDKVLASTKQQPTWKGEMARSNGDKSANAVSYEYNLSFLSVKDHTAAEEIITERMQMSLELGKIGDDELVSALAGDGTPLIDILLYLCPGVDFLKSNLTSISRLQELTNVVPVILNASGDFGGNQKLKSDLSVLAQDNEHHWTHLSDEAPDKSASRLYAVELGHDAVADDRAVPDSTPHEPTVGTFDELLEDLFVPATGQRLRYTAAQKLVQWRQGRHVFSAATLLPPPKLAIPDRGNSSLDSSCITCSTVSSPSGVLVPHADSSFYDTHSPALSGHTIDSATLSREASALALTTLSHDHAPHENLEDLAGRDLHLAQWAVDLQRSLECERQRLTNPLRTGQLQECVSISGSGSGAMVRHGSASPSPSPSPSRSRSAPSKSLAAPRGVRGPYATALGLHAHAEHDPLGLVALSAALKRNALWCFGVGGIVAAAAVLLVRNWERLSGFVGAVVSADARRAPASRLPGHWKALCL